MMSFGFCKEKQQSTPDCSISTKILRHAQQSGILNLTNRSLISVPDKVWDLNDPLPPEDGSAVVDLNRSTGDCRWWETQPITRLVLASNQLTSIPGNCLAKLNTLTHLDLRDNQLSTFPDEVEQLTELRVLNLSANKLRSLPAKLTCLRGLNLLDVSNNQLETLVGDLTTLSNLEFLDASRNKLGSVPDKFPPLLRQLNLNNNCLKRLPVGILDDLRSLQRLDVSSNEITSLVLLSEPSRSALGRYQLVTLNATFNRLTNLPHLAGLTLLKELHLSDNRISSFELSTLKDCPLVTLDLARNCLTQLPDGLAEAFPQLVRLDVSCNEISSLPTELGLMNNLQVLLVERNPLRSIRQNIVSGGTNTLKALLRQRHPQSATSVESTSVTSGGSHKSSEPSAQTHLPSQNSDQSDSTSRLPATKRPPSGSSVNKLPFVNPAGILNWSGPIRGELVAPLPEPDSESSWLEAATQPHASAVAVRSLHLEHRNLLSLPMGLFAFSQTLTSLSLNDNKLCELPDCMNRLVQLKTLDLSRNRLCSIPASLGRLSSLTTLRLDHNPLGPIFPIEVLSSGPVHTTLEHLSLRGCQLTESLPPSQMTPDRMPSLTHLDLSDNAIGSLPSEWGLCTQLRSLQLNGNTFRIPRPATLAKGTPAVLEYLRSRIPS